MYPRLQDLLDSGDWIIESIMTDANGFDIFTLVQRSTRTRHRAVVLIGNVVHFLED